MVEEFSIMLMETSLMESSREIREMDGLDFNKRMVKPMRDSGRMTCSMAKERKLMSMEVGMRGVLH